MSLIDNNNTLLREQLGKGSVEVFSAAAGAQTGKDYYCVYFPLESTVTVLSAANVTAGGQNLIQTYPAGTTLFLRVTAITITSGVGFGYVETDGNAAA